MQGRGGTAPPIGSLHTAANGFVLGCTLRTPSRIRPPAPSRGASALERSRVRAPALCTHEEEGEAWGSAGRWRGAERRGGRRGPERTSAVVLVDLLEDSSGGLSALGRQARHIVQPSDQAARQSRRRACSPSPSGTGRRAHPSSPTCCILQVACCILVACCMLHVASCALRIARCALRVIRCALHVVISSSFGKKSTSPSLEGLRVECYSSAATYVVARARTSTRADTCSSTLCARVRASGVLSVRLPTSPPVSATAGALPTLCLTDCPRAPTLRRMLCRPIGAAPHTRRSPTAPRRSPAAGVPSTRHSWRCG